MSIHIGFLLPRSPKMPRLGRDFIEGFRSTFPAAAGATVSIEDYNAQDPPDSSNEKVQKLLLEKDPDLFIIFGGRSNYKGTAQFLAENKKVNIFSELGANVPHYYSDSPYTLHNSFGLWYASWLAGKHIGAPGKQVAFALDFYESGYEIHLPFTVAAQRQGAMEAFYYVQTHAHYHPETEVLRTKLKTLLPDYLVGMYSGGIGLNFLNALPALAADLPQVYINPAMLDAAVLTQAVAQPSPLYSVASWHPWRTDDFSAGWAKAYTKKTDEIPTAMTVLGAENGLWLKEALAAAGDSPSPRELAEALRKTSFTGPRGKIHVPEGSSSTLADYYHWTIEKGNDSFSVGNPVKLEHADPADWINSLDKEQMMGWRNIYPTN